MAVLLPSSISPGQFSEQVTDEEYDWVVVVALLDPLVILSHLHCKRLSSTGLRQIEMYHAKLIAFEQFSKSCRSRTAYNLESTGLINLHFQVQANLAMKYNLGWADCSARVVYKGLHGYDKNYGTGQYDALFGICR